MAHGAFPGRLAQHNTLVQEEGGVDGEEDEADACRDDLEGGPLLHEGDVRDETLGAAGGSKREFTDAFAAALSSEHGLYARHDVYVKVEGREEVPKLQQSWRPRHLRRSKHREDLEEVDADREEREVNAL